MSTARENILNRINRNKAANSKIPLLPVTEPQPNDVQVTQEQAVLEFEQNVKHSQADCVRLHTAVQLPSAVLEWGKAAMGGVEPHVVVNHSSLEAMDWSRFVVRERLAQPLTSEYIGVGRAVCGIADTGSLMLVAEPGLSSAEYFLPSALVVVVNSSDIVQQQVQAWLRLRSGFARLPRTVTLVTGPSRTGDIEQQLVVGAHGPSKMLVCIVGA